MSEIDWLSGEWADNDFDGLWTDYDEFIWYPDPSYEGGIFVASPNIFIFTAEKYNFTFTAQKNITG